MSTLHDRLEDLAADAPPGDARPGDLWVRGVRRARLQRVAAVAAVAAVTVVAVGTTAVLRTDEPEPMPADVPFEQLHLPKRVNAPGTWSDEVGPDGPLAALGLSLRTVPEGVTGERQHLELYGVSAVDGSAAWIDLPGIRTEDRSLIGWYALSPDGRWIGWSLHDEPPRLGDPAPLLGWAVMDTTTGKVREMADPTAPRLRETASDISFSGDSRYLLTSYETPDAPRSRGHQFVAWDVRDGSRTVLEEPGKHWLPIVGSAPSGVVWSRGGTVHRVDPATASRSSYSLPQAVMAASWAPDDEAFAYIGRPLDRSRGSWRLYAGRSLDEARDRHLRIGVHPGLLLGWRDERHVVVGHYRTTVHVVDVVTGDVVAQPMRGHGELFNPPLLAADLWQNPLVEPVEPVGTTDPRRPYRWGAGALVVLFLGALVVRRRARA